MTVSRNARIDNLANALKLMTQEVGENTMWSVFIDANKPEYQDILPTTWKDLVDRYMVKDHGWGRYQLTGRGWLKGVKLLDLPETPEFNQKMSQLAATLKSRVKGRQQEALVDVWTVAKESGVTVDFVWNAIESKLLDNCFSMKGASFNPNDQNRHYVIIPIDFGMEPL
jgi:hypothetical protein